MTRRPSAFTLVEILAALAILVLVLGAVLALHHAAMRAGERADRQASATPAEQGVERMLRDLNCAVRPDEESACGFRLESRASAAEPDAALLLTFCAATPFDNPTDPRWYGIEHVTYRWAPFDSALIRVAHRVSGAGSDTDQTNIVASAIERLSLQVLDENEWMSSWDGGDLPRAARVTWSEGGQAFTAETFLAAAVTVTGRSVRVGR